MRTVMPPHDADGSPPDAAGDSSSTNQCADTDAKLPTSRQQCFHLRWGRLRDPHVRSLAWLIDSPDLLDPAAPQRSGRIASLGPDAASEASDWLHALDAAPTALHAFLDLRPHARLGRYAEKLLAYYFAWCGTLVAHGIQVRAGKRDTIGEFDFLLRNSGRHDDRGAGNHAVDNDAGDNNTDRHKDIVWHCEFAIKFYLLRGDPDAIRDSADYFVGPNLADTLGAKMEKILDRQLILSRHPAARELLQASYGIESGEFGMDVAQALVKGWLFYPRGEAPALQREKLMGVSPDHCRGFWCTLADLHATRPAAALGGYIVLPRLDWMPPALASPEAACSVGALALLVQSEFARDNMPVLVAEMAPDESGNGLLREVARGFVVPDDWSHRAGLRKPR
jgi:hypothetical protein